MTRPFSTPNRERGAALIIAVFALLLLTVVGMGMLVSAGTEGTIHANYRDKQTALFAAMAGLQEARDRIQPATLNIIPPNALPSLTVGNVIYIINPKNGETVAPWNSSSLYPDTELCQGGVLGLSGTVGVQCSTTPGVSTWYTTYDDSQTGAGVWHPSSTPLDLKWVRISLKTNNMTPVAVNGDSTNSSQVCWDGIHEILLPAGYDPTCIRYGSVKSVTITNGGSSYTSAPTVTIDPPALGGGIQATAHANIAPTSTSQVSSVTVNTPGSLYTIPPTVSFTGGGGSGAVAYATISATGSPVASITLSNPGTVCYATAPTVSFSSGGGSGAAATATLAASNSCITGWTVSGNCNSKKNNTVTGVGLSGASGSGFSSTLTFNSSGVVSGITIQNSGTGYTTVPTSITGLNGCNGLTFTPTLGKVVSSVSLTAGGSGYTSQPTVSFSTGIGTSQTQPSATDTLGSPTSGGQIISVTVTNGGSGYTAAPQVTLTSLDAGSGATATANIGAITYQVSSVTVDNNGKGYTAIPNVMFSGGGGTGATGVANLGGGANWGMVYNLTALAQTKSGARAMLQMEAATQLSGFNAAAALVIDGPNPAMDAMPNSNNFYIRGTDANTCNDATGDAPHPAIGGYDDPNASPATNSIQTIDGSLPRTDHYIGDGPTPSVENIYGGLGDTLGTPQGLLNYTQAIRSQANNTAPYNAGTLLTGTPSTPQINYINDDLTLNGNATGYGILVVTGTLRMSGNFSWYGTVLIVGDGDLEFSGGGNGSIYGTVITAKIWDSRTSTTCSGGPCTLAALGSPTIHWNGGGGNGIYYDHCWATDLMSKIYFNPPVSTKPLKVLSLRTLPY